MGKEEAELGVSLVPGRDVCRLHRGRWSGGRGGAPIVRRPLLVGAAMVSNAALVAAVVVGTAPIAAAAAVALMVPAAVVDVEQRRLPDAWAGGALLVLIAALGVGAVIGSQIDTARTIVESVGGALAMSLPVLVLHLASPSAMGFGDVKAALVLGAAVGTIDWRLGAVALCLAALSGAMFGLLRRRHTIPFGPFLVFGAWAAVLANDSIVTGLFAGGPTP